MEGPHIEETNATPCNSSKFPNIAEMSAAQYKSYHESLMQNNDGSSALHVFFCIFFTVQCTIYSGVAIKKWSNQYMVEYIVIIMPLILAHTVLSDYLLLLNLIIFSMLLWELRQHLHMTYILKIRKGKCVGPRIQTITIMRGLTYLITVMCILAVDFKSFPRELAKTERYGYSLMDTGVGLFVMMSGIVHKDITKTKWLHALKSNLKFLTILLILGASRYFAVKILDYQEHVSEYGIHWNFFYTLALCKFLSSLLLYFPIARPLLLSCIILISHELILVSSVEEWVFGNAPRDSLLSANREGLSSCLGYVAMYVFATYVKDLLINKHGSVGIFLSNGMMIDPILVKLAGSSVIGWVLTYLTNYNRPASRTLANSAYCIFIATILLTVVTVLYFFEKYFQSQKGLLETPKIIAAVNSNGLVYFIIANLMTGAVNLTMRTFELSSLHTFLVLNKYMLATLAFTVFLNRKGVTF